MAFFLVLVLAWALVLYPTSSVEVAFKKSCVGDAGVPAKTTAGGGGPALRLHLKRRPGHTAAAQTEKSSLLASARRDFLRMGALGKSPPPSAGEYLTATLESGVAMGSGEYLMDVYVGTPARHFSVILDTGSDLNWLQCAPCHDCFEQRGEPYDPSSSASYAAVACGDPRCGLVSAPSGEARRCPDPGRAPCPYYYWYGDSSNTTGDLAVETFTVDTSGRRPRRRRIEGVVFGCGHWNRGLFHGAGGLLGLGRGPLSFASQLRPHYGHTFSYCFVDRDSDLSVTGKLVFGGDSSRHPGLSFTSFAPGDGDTFYYLDVKSISVGGEVLDIPAEAFAVSPDGTGGTIIDSGTTLSYFAAPAYEEIRRAFLRGVRGYPLLEEGMLPPLGPCYNVSGAGDGGGGWKAAVPELAIVFGDGAEWRFPAENYFVRMEAEGVMCLAIVGSPATPAAAAPMSIIGNYLQQNFHIVYDTNNSRLGFAPANCANQ